MCMICMTWHLIKFLAILNMNSLFICSWCRSVPTSPPAFPHLYRPMESRLLI